MINELRVLIAEFQMQTNSSSVLDFVIWLENKELYIQKHMPVTNKDIGNRLAEAILNQNTKKREDKKK